MKKNFNTKSAYYLFLLIRKSEEKIIDLYDTDKIKSPVHLSIGQEAIAVGVSLALKKEDIVFSSYRGHAHYIACGGNLKEMWAELYGKIGGSSRGKAGSMHLSDWSVNFMTTSAIVTSAIPEAVGYAYAQKYKNQDGVVICYHGDGAVDEGVYWESLNFASLHQLPILFVCENNKYAIYTHQNKRMLGDSIVERANSFGVKSLRVDGSSTEDFYNATNNSLDKIRSNSGPMLIECLTARWRDHVGPGEDRHIKFRSDKDLDDSIKSDDLHNLEKLLSKKEVEKIQSEVDTKLNEAINYAEESTFPEISEITDEVYG
jgi:TPP-dependent pyruvate/acetoin dehydrogenase alpha subunit